MPSLFPPYSPSLALELFFYSTKSSSADSSPPLYLLLYSSRQPLDSLDRQCCSLLSPCQLQQHQPCRHTHHHPWPPWLQKQVLALLHPLPQQNPLPRTVSQYIWTWTIEPSSVSFPPDATCLP